jgi:hypothetical protein
MPLVGAGGDDVGQLGDGVPHLLHRVEEVRTEPHAARGIGTEITDDPALAELVVAGGVVGRRDGDRTATPIRLARRDDLEPGLSQRSISSCVSTSERSRIRSTPTSSITS